MGRGSLRPWSTVASALCLIALCSLSAVAHDDRPRPILRIDERLERAAETHMSGRRQACMLLRRAHFSRQSGAPAAALADLDRALALGAKGRRMSYERGLALEMLARDADALPALDRFLATGRPNALALDARARIHERAGRLEPALSDYSASLALRDEAEIYLARGRVLQALRRWDDAAEGYRTALARLGKAELLEKALVSTLSACGRHDAALAAVDAHLRSGRVTTDWLLLRGDALERAGDGATARATREHALANAEDALARKKTAILYFERARAHFALGHLQDARADLERVLSAAAAFEPAIELAKAVQLAAGDQIPNRTSESNANAAGGRASTERRQETDHARSGPN